MSSHAANGGRQGAVGGHRKEEDVGKNVDDGDEMDEESELRACALEAQLAFKEEEAAPPPGSPVDSEVIVIDSDTEDGPPAQSRADKMRGAMAQLETALGNRIGEDGLREALEETRDEGKSQTEWVEAAQIWFTERDDMNREMEDMKLAMAASLREAEQQRVPLKFYDDDMLKERFKSSSVLGEVGWIPHPQVRDVLVDFLELEEKCRRWWTGITGFFEDVGSELQGIASTSASTSANGTPQCKETPSSKRSRSSNGAPPSSGKNSRKRRACGSPSSLQPRGGGSGAPDSGTGVHGPSTSNGSRSTEPGAGKLPEGTPGKAGKGLNGISEEAAEKIAARLTQKIDEICSEFIQPSAEMPTIFQRYAKSRCTEIVDIA